MNWLGLWDDLREKVLAKNSWGKNELLELMEKLERAEIRRLEQERTDKGCGS